MENTRFKVNEILHLLKDKEEDVRLKAGQALATFAYNDTGQVCQSNGLNRPIKNLERSG